MRSLKLEIGLGDSSNPSVVRTFRVSQAIICLEMALVRGSSVPIPSVGRTHGNEHWYWFAMAHGDEALDMQRPADSSRFVEISSTLEDFEEHRRYRYLEHPTSSMPNGLFLCLCRGTFGPIGAQREEVLAELPAFVSGNQSKLTAVILQLNDSLTSHAFLPIEEAEQFYTLSAPAEPCNHLGIVQLKYLRNWLGL